MLADCAVRLSALSRRKRGLHGHRDGDRKGLQVGDAHVEGAQTKQFGSLASVAMQGDGRATAAQLHDLHLAPSHAVNAGSQRLADGLLGGETPRQSRRLAPALANLRLRKDALEEPLAMMLVN